MGAAAAGEAVAAEVVADEAAATEPDADTGGTPQHRSAGRRLPWWAWLLIAVAVVGIAVGAVVAVLSGRSGSPTATTTVTATAPAPTPTAQPLERGDGSALYLAVPGTVNQYALTALTAQPDWTGTYDAIEAYTATYTGTVDPLAATPQDGTFTVEVGQWQDEAAASAAAEQIAVAAVGADAVTGTVQVAGKQVGTSWLPSSAGTTAPAAAGTTAAGAAASVPATAVWTNGTVVVQAQGPSAELQRFFDGYGL